jgi:hypothetical protein
MVPVGADLQELDLLASLDPQTDVSQRLINRRIEHRAAVFGREHQMVEQDRDVMALVDVGSSKRLTPQAAGNVTQRDSTLD